MDNSIRFDFLYAGGRVFGENDVRTEFEANEASGDLGQFARAIGNVLFVPSLRNWSEKEAKKYTIFRKEAIGQCSLALLGLIKNESHFIQFQARNATEYHVADRPFPQLHVMRLRNNELLNLFRQGYSPYSSIFNHITKVDPRTREVSCDVPITGSRKELPQPGPIEARQANEGYRNDQYSVDIIGSTLLWQNPESTESLQLLARMWLKVHEKSKIVIPYNVPWLHSLSTRLLLVEALQHLVSPDARYERSPITFALDYITDAEVDVMFINPDETVYKKSTNVIQLDPQTPIKQSDEQVALRLLADRFRASTWTEAYQNWYRTCQHFKNGYSLRAVLEIIGSKQEYTCANVQKLMSHPDLDIKLFNDILGNPDEYFFNTEVNPEGIDCLLEVGATSSRNDIQEATWNHYSKRQLTLGDLFELYFERFRDTGITPRQLATVVASRPESPSLNDLETLAKTLNCWPQVLETLAEQDMVFGDDTSLLGILVQNFFIENDHVQLWSTFEQALRKSSSLMDRAVQLAANRNRKMVNGRLLLHFVDSEAVQKMPKACRKVVMEQASKLDYHIDELKAFVNLCQGLFPEVSSDLVLSTDLFKQLYDATGHDHDADAILSRTLLFREIPLLIANEKSAKPPDVEEADFRFFCQKTLERYYSDHSGTQGQKIVSASDLSHLIDSEIQVKQKEHEIILWFLDYFPLKYFSGRDLKRVCSDTRVSKKLAQRLDEENAYNNQFVNTLNQSLSTGDDKLSQCAIEVLLQSSRFDDSDNIETFGFDPAARKTLYKAMLIQTNERNEQQKKFAKKFPKYLQALKTEQTKPDDNISSKDGASLEETEAEQTKPARTETDDPLQSSDGPQYQTNQDGVNSNQVSDDKTNPPETKALGTYDGKFIFTYGLWIILVSSIITILFIFLGIGISAGLFDLLLK